MWACNGGLYSETDHQPPKEAYMQPIDGVDCMVIHSEDMTIELKVADLKLIVLLLKQERPDILKTEESTVEDQNV